jgi:hypothetical protein
VLVLALSGCATPVVMLKNDRTGQIARCGGGSTGFVAGGLIGQSIERESDERCVRDYQAQGFRRMSRSEEPTAATQAPQALPPPPTVVSLGESKWLVSAEGIARANGCSPPTAKMVSKTAGQEMIAVECPSGATMAIRCETDGCRVLR